MTTQILDKTDSATESTKPTTPAKQKAADTPARKDKGPSKLGVAWRRLRPATSSDGLPVLIWAAFYRSVVLIADYLLGLGVAIVVIPMIAAWLHRESGVAAGQLTMSGTIAMWMAPLLFVVLILAAGVIAVMRAMWRWSSRRIQHVRDVRAEASGSTSTGSTTPTTRPSKKNNRKRSK